MAEVDNEVLQSARAKADARLNNAVGALRKAAAEIGRSHDIPDGIQGHSVEELLGRIAYVPSLSRELARAAGQALSKQEIDALVSQPRPQVQPQVRTVDTSTMTRIPSGLDLADLPGITPQMVKQLKAAGMNQVQDVVSVPDEHLAKVLSWEPKQVGKLRAAVSKASTPAGDK
jgi:hypothetical protein